MNKFMVALCILVMVLVVSLGCSKDKPNEPDPDIPQVPSNSLTEAEQIIIEEAHEVVSAKADSILS